MLCCCCQPSKHTTHTHEFKQSSLQGSTHHIQASKSLLSGCEVVPSPAPHLSPRAVTLATRHRQPDAALVRRTLAGRRRPCRSTAQPERRAGGTAERWRGEEGRGAEGDRRRRDPEVHRAACALAPPLPMRTGAVERLEGRCRDEMGS
jgi:hypothetical protein